MSAFSSEQLAALLRAAESRPLTEAEQAMLEKLLATDDGKLVASVHQHLQEYYVASGQDAQWSAEALRAISAEINTALPRQKRRNRITNIAQQFGYAAIAIAAVVGFIFSWPFIDQNGVEPVAQPTVVLTPTLSPTPTPQPTATLNRNYVYVSLLDVAVTTTNFLEDTEYTQPLDRVLERWDGELYLPQQMQATMSFSGARLNESAGVLELAFVLAGPSGDMSFILAQRSAENHDLTPPLPVIYQPLARVDVTNIYDDEAIMVGEFPAYAYQYENVLRDEASMTNKNAAWVVYNTITWQQEGQLFTLNWIHDSLVPSSTLATMADNFQLARERDR